MSTFIGKTVIANQLGVNFVMIQIPGYGGVALPPAEAVELGKWLMTVRVPEVKPETGPEINLKEVSGQKKESFWR